MKGKLIEKILPEEYRDGIPSLDLMVGGETFDLHEINFLGRNKDACNIVIPMYKNHVSRVHLKVERIQAGFYFQDLSSKNGTRIESKHVSSSTIQPGILYPLHDGDYLVLGFNPIAGVVFQFKEER